MKPEDAPQKNKYQYQSFYTAWHKADRMMRLSQDTFYRYNTAVGEGGMDALFDQNRHIPDLKNAAPEIETIVVDINRTLQM